MQTSSVLSGTRAGDQLPAASHAPPDGFVHETVHAWEAEAEAEAKAANAPAAIRQVSGRRKRIFTAVPSIERPVTAALSLLTGLSRGLISRPVASYPPAHAGAKRS